MNFKSFLYYLLIPIVFISLVNIGAFIQVTEVLKIPLEGVFFIIPSLIGTVFSLLFILFIHFYQKTREMLIYEKLAKTDTLTGVTSRYACELILDIEHKRNQRNQIPFSIIMIDIDDFKAINDTYGHAVGDRVLCSLTRHLESNLRSMDVICRWGGEEFLVLLADTGVNEALAIAEHLCQCISSYDFGISKQVTISLGVASIKGDIEKMIERSDKALYKAKELGKNRVIFEA